MALRLLATTCQDGDCPKLYLDEETGDIVLQGYVTDVPAPAGEGGVRMSRAEWDTLLAQFGR